MRVLSLLFLLTSLLFPLSGQAQSTPILATTYPVWLLTRNIIASVPALTVDLMLPAQAGCPHDYALTPHDMQKLSKAEVLITNGLGLESFLENQLERLNPDVRILDATKGITDVILYPETDEHEEAEHASEAHKHEEAGHEHHHTGINPHMFSSPRMLAKMALALGDQLAALNPNVAQQLKQNAADYARRLNLLADDFTALGAQLQHPRLITQHDIFDYLARDSGLTVIAVLQSGEAPSAAVLMQLSRTIQKERVQLIITEPQYPDRTGQMLARETHTPLLELDPVATGPSDVPLTYYETVMRTNLQRMEKALEQH